jgi:3-dehydroquinate dehydratase-1
MRRSLKPGIFRELGRRPLIVASIGGKGRLVESARKAYRSGADLIEIRIDMLLPKEQKNVSDFLSALKASCPLPQIATVRSAREREPNSRSGVLRDEERKAIYERSIPFAELIDIEINSDRINRPLIRKAHKAKKKVILSYHDFKGVPGTGKIHRLLEKFKRLSGDILKIAGMPGSASDAEQFMKTCSSLRGIKRIFIAMGRPGKDSRLNGFCFGSCMSYGHVGKATAPGQVSVKKLAEHFKSRYLS